ncbi:MAG TPA: S8 family peptidase, partial [Pyrinomonadaceae bacterium]
MTPSNNRPPYTRMLALALAAGLCVIATTGGRAAGPAQGGGRLADRVSGELRSFAARTRAATVGVVVQLSAPPSGRLNALLQRNGVRVRGHFASLDAMAVELPAGVIDELADFPEVEWVTRDRAVSTAGHVTSTTGAAAVRTLPALKGGGSTSVDGTGVGIAVLDSGVYAAHVALKDAGGGPRTVYAKDFTGEGTTADSYGHGSHVASTAAGNDNLAGQNGNYEGVAPNSTLVNLRVLDRDGRGRVSNVLAALDWVVASGSKYRIRVVNMSLGMPAVDSYTVDPLCRAVRRLSDAGYVVVVAAGNDGKTTINKYGTNNTRTYGLVHSPGNEPSAVTVGASNTFGTDDRGDDAVATYSSRGPTRGFWTDLAGVRHHDNFIKPDIVAPGNKIVDAAAEDNYLITNNPQLDAGVSGSDKRRMMYLNGTSMATPVAAGAAALMLQVNPKLTPNLVKAILMYTAQPLSGFNMLEQGAGEVNVEGAVRLARLVRTDISTRTKAGDPLLTAAMPAPASTI